MEIAVRGADADALRLGIKFAEGGKQRLRQILNINRDIIITGHFQTSTPDNVTFGVHKAEIRVGATYVDTDTKLFFHILEFFDFRN